MAAAKASSGASWPPPESKKFKAWCSFSPPSAAPTAAFTSIAWRTDKDTELVWWGEGVSEGYKEHLEKLPEAERKAIRIESPIPGAIQGNINRQVLPNLREISVTGWDKVRLFRGLDQGRLPDRQPAARPV